MTIFESRLLVVAHLLCDEAAVERVLVPLLGDWHHERAGQQGLARTISDVGWAMAASRALVNVVAFAPLPGHLIRGGIATLAAFMVAGTALQLGTWRGPVLVLPYLIPSTMVVALALAALPASVYVAASPDTAWQRLQVLLRLAFATTAVLGIASESPVPMANQHYREHVSATLGLKNQNPGIRELRTTELLLHGDSTIEGTAARQERHRRLALLAMPAVMALLGLAVARHLRRRPSVLLSGAIWTAGGLWFIATAEIQRGFGPAGAWARIALTAMVAALLIVAARDRQVVHGA